MRSRRKRLGKRENGRDKGGRGRCVDVTGQARCSVRRCWLPTRSQFHEVSTETTHLLRPSSIAVPIIPNEEGEISTSSLPLRRLVPCFRDLSTWRENSKSDAAVDRTTSGSGVAEDHVANRVNDSRLKFNARCVTVLSRASSLISSFLLLFLLLFFETENRKYETGNLAEEELVGDRLLGYGRLASLPRLKGKRR